MLLGRISRVGELVRHRGFAVGDRIATLASLSLTPLRVSKIHAIRPISAQVDVEGTAVIFATAPLAKLPTDLPERLALAILDVAGAARPEQFEGKSAWALWEGKQAAKDILAAYDNAVAAAAKITATPTIRLNGEDISPNTPDELIDASQRIVEPAVE